MNKNLTQTTEWKIVTGKHGTVVIVACPLCGNKLTRGEDSYLWEKQDDEHSKRCLEEAIEHCLRQHTGRDEDYPMGRNKRTCSAPIVIDESAYRIFLAFDNRYWLEEYTYEHRFDTHNWELHPIDESYSDWLHDLILAQKEIMREAERAEAELKNILEYAQATERTDNHD